MSEGADKDVTFNKRKLKGAMHKGRMVGSYLDKGKSPKGEANVEQLNELIRSASRFAEDSLNRERYPAEYREMPIRYFERALGEGGR